MTYEIKEIPLPPSQDDLGEVGCEVETLQELIESYQEHQLVEHFRLDEI